MWPFSKLKEKTKENSSQEFTTESFVNKISPLRVPLLFLIGFGLAALTIEIISQYVLTPKSSSRQRAELNTKKLFYLQPFSNYQDIISKNIFCPGCPIPDLEARKVEHPKDCNKADRLGGGIKLIGTIVNDKDGYKFTFSAPPLFFLPYCTHHVNNGLFCDGRRNGT